MAELYMDDFKNKIAAISGGVNPNAAVWGGDDGRRYTDVDMGQTIYMPTEESMEPAPMESPKEAANEPVVDTWGDAHKENALKKYYGHDEATLETVRNITKNNNNVSENLMLSDPEYMKHVQDLELENAKDIDPNTIYKEFPELEKLAKDGKEIEAAIAANNLKDIRMQKSIMQHYQDTLRYEEINSELKSIAQAERYGGKDIDENRVKALQKELKTLDNGGFEEHPLDVIIGGTMQQAGQMLRSTLKGVERGIEGGVMVGTLSAAAGTAVPVVGNVGGAVGGFATGFGLGMRAGYFEGSYNEMVDLNYLQLRMQKNADGTNVYTKSQAAVIAPVQAALSAGIESFNTGAILERIGGAKTIAAKQIKDILTNAETKESAWNALGVFVKDMVKSNLKTTAEESAEEAVQSVSDDLVLNLASLAYDTPTVSVGQIAQNAKENFMEALPVSFGFGLVGNAASLSGGVRKVARAASFNNETKQQLNRIENGNNIVAQLKEHIANSDFFKKSPEVAQEVLRQQLADSGLDTVYIDAQDLVQTDNGRALVEDCLNKLDLSEEQKINILAGKEDFHMPTEVYMQTELSDSQSGKEYITYQASDECFAKHRKYAEIMRQDMVDFLKTEIEQKKEINQAIVENLYEDKNDQALAAKLLQEHGMNKIGQYLNEKIGVLNDSINKILEKYTPERDALEIESGVDYYVPGKGRGYYVDFDGNYVDAADLGSDTKGEQKNWKWTPAVKSIEQPWVQNWKAENKGRLTKAEIQKVVIDAMNGNDKYGIFPDGMLADPETVAEIQKDLATLQEAQSNLATLNKMKEGFAKLDSDENVLAQGLSDEGYKVYRELYEALKNSPSAESREAARYNAILLARHADRFADAMRAAGKENYSAIDYINERLRVDLNATEAKEGALKQNNGQIVINKNAPSIISLFKTANQSTFMHETGHMALQDLKELAEMEGAPEQIKKDWETVKQWLNYKDDQEGFTVKQQEKFARGFEAYLRTGEAPAVGLKRIFRQFKKWLCDIYSDFKQLGGEPSVEVKAVMSRMLCTQEEIDMAARRSDHRRFVRAGGLDFMDTTTAERYQKWQEEAIEEAKEKVMKKAMQDVAEDIAELRKEQEQSIRDAVETEYAENEILAANDLIQSMPEEKREILAYYNLNEDVYEENLAALGGSREAAVNKKTQEELDKLFYNEAVEENIRAEAEQAIAEGKYNDMLYELETEILQEKQKAEERVGKLADEKLQAIEKELSGIDPNNYTPEKLSALQRKVNDLMYTIRWNQAETDMLLNLQKAIEHAKLEAEILSHKADVKDLKKQLSDLRKSAAADLRQAKKDAKKEQDYNKRWAEAETRILLDIEKAKGKEVADDLKHQIKEAQYNARWQAAEQNYILESEKAKGQEAVAKEKRKQAEAEYNARWREAELNFVIDEFKGKLKDMTEDFNEYRKSVRTGLRSVRDAEKGGMVKALKEYVSGWGFNFTQNLRESTNERYWRNESTKHSRNSYSAMSKDNWQEAAREKREGIYANIVANQCAKNAKYVDKTITRLQRKAKTLKKRQHMYGEYSYLFNKLMWMYGFSEERPVRPEEYAGVEDTLLALKGAGFDLNADPSNVGANDLPNWLANIDSDQRPDGGYKDNLTILQFKELTDFMLTLYKAGSEIRIRDLEGRRVNAENIAQDIANRMGERIDKLPDAGKKKFHQEKTFWEKTIETGKQGLFDLLNIETILDYMGPEAKDFIYNRINDAYAKEMRMQKEVNKQLKTALEFLDKGWLEKDYQIAGETVTGKELLAVALNCGTELGRQRILDSKQMDQNTLNKALSNLTDNEWKFVQSVWDIFGGLWPEARAVQVAINGAAPRTEQASAFTITDVNGNVHDIKGGYYPLAYDTAQNIRTAQQQATNAAKGAATNTNMMRNSGTGFMKERASKVSEQVVLTDLNLLGRALNDQVHFICMRESYLDVSRLVNTEAFKNAVVDHFGVKMWQAINTWTNDQWARATPQLNIIERLARTARQNSTLAILGWRTGTAVLNVSNITNLMLYLGPQRTMKAIWEYYGNGMMQRRTAIFEKSMFMQERAATIERDVREQLNKEIAIGHLDKADVARKKFIEASFNFITETDLMLALPLWQEEYQRAYKEAGINGKSAEIAEREGVRAGDMAVRKMFGSGLPQDLNVYQKGSEMSKTLTTFYSYFSVIGNAVASGYLQSKVNKKQGMQGVKAWAPFVRSMLYMVLLQSVVDALVRQGMDMAGGDDWDSEEFAKKSATNVVENLLGFVPVARDVVPRYIEALLGERERDFRIPIFTWAQQLDKTFGTAVNPKKDAADFAYEVARFFSLSTGVSTTVIDSIPTTLRYLDDVERYDLKDYISSLILDRRLKKDKK